MGSLKDFPIKDVALIAISVSCLIAIATEISVVKSFESILNNLKRKTRRLADCAEKLLVGSLLIGIFQSNKDAIYLALIFASILILLEYLLDE